MGPRFSEFVATICAGVFGAILPLLFLAPLQQLFPIAFGPMFFTVGGSIILWIAFNAQRRSTLTVGKIYGMLILLGVTLGAMILAVPQAFVSGLSYWEMVSALWGAGFGGVTATIWVVVHWAMIAFGKTNFERDSTAISQTPR